MTHSNRFLIGFLVLAYACFQLPEEPSNDDTAVVSEESLSANELWQKNRSSRSAEWSNLYTEDAIKVFPNLRIINGLDSMASYYYESPQTIDTIYTQHQIVAHNEKSITYEIGGYQSNGQHFKHLLIWYPAQVQPKRAFEFIARAQEMDFEENVKEVLASRRMEWEKRCNAHDIENLVKALYTNPPLYYNHRPLVTDQEELIKVYRYMADPKYSLYLEPLAIEIVNPNLVFEIGQCSGSYGGKYIFIWQLDQDGQWRVLLDGNL